MRRIKFTMTFNRAFAMFAAVLMLATSSFMPVAQAISPEQRKIFEDGIGYFNFRDNECGSATGSTAPGTLPAIIPEPYNGAFTAAGNEFKVAPALVAAIFTAENFWGIDVAQLPDRWAKWPTIHPDPNSGWPTSSANAQGPFQFIPGTWASMGMGGDVNKLVDASRGAANYLAHEGGTTDKPPEQWRDAIFAYNRADWYVAGVMKYYEYYASGATGAAPAASGGSSGCGQQTATNCQGSGGAVSGKAAILCEARKFDPFGYLWGGGHEDPEAFMTRFNSAGGFTQPFKQYVDCSGIITVAIWNAYKAKVVFSTAVMPSSPQWFKEIPIASSQPGDFVWRPGHVEIVSEPGATATFGAHTDSAPPEDQISDAKEAPSAWSKAYVYVGPGSTP